MFSGFMTNAWIVSTIAAVIAGVVGFFVVLRGDAFPAHAIPNGAFSGAAGAALLGVNELLGLASFAVAAALAIAWFGRRGRPDAVTALTLVTLLALGSAFLSQTTEYSAQIFSLLFGEVLGVSTTEILPVAALGAVCLAAVALLFRPLLLSSAVPEVAEASGIDAARMEAAFLVVLALATALTVPVVGALLIFSLMIGPPAAARSLSDRPLVAGGLGVALAVVTVWAAIASSYLTNWPVGFFVGTYSALVYGIGRGAAALAARRSAPELTSPGLPVAVAVHPLGEG
ncbi:MAG: metal ABC transporter permease [Acidimicrobiales bacterium]|nr:metal ABC transporter permease [Acidimicrobiales bacterium]